MESQEDQANIPKGCIEICRACRYRNVSLNESIAYKQKFLDVRLSRWGNKIFPIETVEEIDRWNYRERVTLRAFVVENKFIFGFEIDEIPTNMNQCPIHSLRINKILRELENLLSPFSSLLPLAFIVINYGQLTLVLKTKEISYDLKNELKESLAKLLGSFVDGIWLNFHPACGKKVMAYKKFEHLLGRKNSNMPTGLTYGPASFLQVNWPLYQSALDKIESFFLLNEKSWVLDLYCGLGESIRRFRQQTTNILGIEMSPDCFELANLNMPGIFLLRGKCAQRVPQIQSWLNTMEQDSDLYLFINPPRTGIEREVLDIIKNMRPRIKRMAYLSCSPNTLERDLLFLEESDFEISSIVPYDFFPNTRHIENLVLLQ